MATNNSHPEFSQNSPPWLHCLESCESTNTWAIAHLGTLAHGDVVFTARQTQGRGQRGRVWYAPPGVLTLSVVLDRLAAAQLAGFSLLAGLAMIYAIEEVMPSLQNQLKLKWTNDILLNGRKLAGILCEGVTIANHTQLVVGIGLNRQADFSNIDQIDDSILKPISLHEVASVPDEFIFLDRIRYYLLQATGLLQSSQHSQKHSILQSLLPTLRDRDALLGHSITLELPQERVTGEAAGLDDRGCLLLRLPDQTIRSFLSAHVIWQPTNQTPKPDKPS